MPRVKTIEEKDGETILLMAARTGDDEDAYDYYYEHPDHPGWGKFHCSCYDIEYCRQLRDEWVAQTRAQIEKKFHKTFEVLSRRCR